MAAITIDSPAPFPDHAPMLLLAIELSTATGSVALFKDQDCLAARSWIEPANGHRLFFQNLRSMLSESGISAAELTSVAVDTGPGVFSGLRIALSCAEALALPGKLPVLGISTGEILMGDHHLATRESHAWVVGDARRDQFWFCRTTMETGRPSLAPPYALTAPSELAESVLAQPATVLTPHWDRIGSTLLHLGIPGGWIRQTAAIPRAQALGGLAAAAIRHDPACEFPRLIYMHPPVAYKPEACATRTAAQGLLF